MMMDIIREPSEVEISLYCHGIYKLCTPESPAGTSYACKPPSPSSHSRHFSCILCRSFSPSTSKTITHALNPLTKISSRKFPSSTSNSFLGVPRRCITIHSSKLWIPLGVSASLSCILVLWIRKVSFSCVFGFLGVVCIPEFAGLFLVVSDEHEHFSWRCMNRLDSRVVCADRGGFEARWLASFFCFSFLCPPCCIVKEVDRIRQVNV